MHPAASIILFTTASGAGYGMLVFVALFALAGWLPADRAYAATAMALSLGLIAAGLAASTFHLGQPQRAWRALSQWRSSWLSREGLLALLTFIPALVFAFGWLVRGEPGGAWPAAALAAGLLAVATVHATAMIYASLKTIHQWHNRHVPAGYHALALMSGGLWMGALAAGFDRLAAPLAGLLILLVVAAAIVKLRYWSFIDGTSHPSTAGTATGLGGFGPVRLLEAPTTSESYVMREMGFAIARRHAGRLRRIAVTLAFVVPVACLFPMIGVVQSGAGQSALALLAALAGTGGVLVERWLFFAEARHVVTLYHGAETA